MTRGHRGSLLLRCRAFSSLSSCRFIPAHPTFRAGAADRARAAFTPDTAWPISGHPPGSSRRLLASPVLMSSSCFDASSAVRSRSPSRSPPDASKCAFSSSLTTTVTNQRSMRRFDASPRRATPKGQQSFITCTAPHQEISYGDPSLRSWRTQDQPAEARGNFATGSIAPISQRSSWSWTRSVSFSRLLTDLEVHLTVG